MTLALMWEAKAPQNSGPQLLAWAREQELADRPVRRETLTAPGDRVLVITWWDTDQAADPPELPDPPPELAARPVHRWRFERAYVEE
jgi:hypothetical protein